MDKTEAIQQIAENNVYLRGLARRVRIAGLDEIAEDLEAIALHNEECLEVLVEQQGENNVSFHSFGCS